MAEFEDGDIGETALSFQGTKKKRKKNKKEKKEKKKKNKEDEQKQHNKEENEKEENKQHDEKKENNEKKENVKDQKHKKVKKRKRNELSSQGVAQKQQSEEEDNDHSQDLQGSGSFSETPVRFCALSPFSSNGVPKKQDTCRKLKALHENLTEKERQMKRRKEIQKIQKKRDREGTSDSFSTIFDEQDGSPRKKASRVLPEKQAMKGAGSSSPDYATCEDSD